MRFFHSWPHSACKLLKFARVSFENLQSLEYLSCLPGPSSSIFASAVNIMLHFRISKHHCIHPRSCGTSSGPSHKNTFLNFLVVPLPKSHVVLVHVFVMLLNAHGSRLLLAGTEVRWQILCLTSET
jgi:hypothetical protein